MKVLNIGLYLLLLTPLIFWSDFFFPAMSPKILWVIFFSEILFCCFAWACYFSSSVRPRLWWPVAIFGFFLFVLALSSLFGVYPQNSVWGDLERSVSLLIWLHLGLVLVVLLSHLRSQKALQNISIVLATIGLIVTFFYFISPYFSNEISRLLNSGSTLGNSSFFGTYLLFELFFSLFLAFTATKLLKWFGVICSVIFLLTLFSTDARAVMISVFGGAILFLGLVLFFSWKFRVQKIAGITLMIGLGLTFFVTILLAFKTDSFLNMWIVNHGSGSRFVVWDIAWDAFTERPLLGWGPENFRYAFLTHYDPCFGGTFCGGNILFDKAHNVILDTLVEYGVLGLLAYLSILFVILYRVWTAHRQKRLDVRICALIVATLVAYIVQNLTVFDTVTSLLFFIIFYAFIINLTSIQTNGTNILKKVSPFFPVVVTCLLPFTLFFFVVQPLRGIAAIKTAVTSLNAPERFRAYTKGLNLSPLGRDVRRDFLGLQTANLLWSYHPINDAETVKKMKPYLQREVDLVKQALRDTLQHSPNDFRSYLYLTKLLQVEGRLFNQTVFTEAQALLEEALARNPKQKTLHWIRVSLLLEQGNNEVALEYEKLAAKISPDQKRTLWNVFLFAMYLQDKSFINASLQQLIQFYPQLKEQAEALLTRDPEERKYEILSQFYLD
jgi:O-antigen ligase